MRVAHLSAHLREFHCGERTHQVQQFFSIKDSAEMASISRKLEL